MANILKIGVDNPAELLDASAFGAGALIRVESSATGGGAGFSEVGTTALVDGTYIYTFYDTSGEAGAFYRHRFSTATPAVAGDYSPYSDEYLGGVDTGLCTIYDVKQRLGIPASDTSEDENLLGYISQATAYIQNYTGRWFLPTTGTYTFDGNNDTELHIPVGIQSVSALTVASETGGTPVAVTDFVLRPSPIYRHAGWPATRIALTDNAPVVFYSGFDTVSVTGTYGWASVPSDIEEVALDIVVALHRERGASGGDSVTINIDGSRTYERALSWRSKGILDFYAIKRV